MNRESINWVKPPNQKKDVDIAESAESIRGNILKRQQEYLSSRIRNS